MADHGLTGTHHLDGSPCWKTEECPWSATVYMQSLMAGDHERMSEQSDRAWNLYGHQGHNSRLNPKDTTVLSCGCDIKWEVGHGRVAETSDQVLLCATHGITTIAGYR